MLPRPFLLKIVTKLLNFCRFFKKNCRKCININFLGEKPHRCDVCDKRFSSTSNLKTHLRLHNGQRPYSCERCQLSFTQFVHLKLHARIHNNERPFNCAKCGRQYISPSGLRTHWKNTGCCSGAAIDDIELNYNVKMLPISDFKENGGGDLIDENLLKK